MADPQSAIDNHIVTEALTWRPLRIFCVYRLLLACLLVGGFLVGTRADLFKPTEPTLFLGIAAAYLPFALAMLALATRRQRAFLQQVTLQGVVDVLAIGALVHASGGLQAGLGVLMLVAVAGNGLLAGVRLGTFFAALATLTLLVDQFLLGLAGAPGGSRYTEAALLGIATFVTAIGGAFLARWARENEALAHRRGIDIADLEALNAHIVQRMETGVIAIDSEGCVRLTNAAARSALLATDAPRPPLGRVAPALAKAYARWQQDWESDASPITDSAGQAEYLPRFQPIGPHGENGTLVFLDNLTQMRAHVQQAKLASLGRLTASIAHEVRNPLGAMLQASQLLGEADYLEAGDRRLLEIIQKQGRRMNKTVENVLALSRRAPAERERIAMDDWLARLAEEWREQQPATLRGAALETELAPVEALFDPDHLRQIVENLMRNAAEHAASDTPPTIRLRCAPLDGERGVLEVADNGRGIAAAVRDHLFEPFATGSATGTGLGLYLARELCEANQARIRAEDAPCGGAQFLVTFMRPPARQLFP
jgi:two-component system sensor histidine kinase PilS (NtrC family)